ncbi:MAG TPA: FAD/NAD(P)-binding oxidoreductase [Acidobacteriaceae bacterium]|jgi:sulfide:quinone oxidoreductase
MSKAWQRTESSNYDIVLVGGGTAGITTAARLVKLLRKENLNSRILIIDPAENHYYQPIWTLVGAGVYPKEVSLRKERDLIPRAVDWLQEEVVELLPDRNIVQTKQGSTITYRYLVVCAGLKVDWGKIPGLAESVGKKGVCSNYSYETVETTWKNVREFRGGTAIFTQPLPPIKCGGAPQKIMYLADSYFRKSGVRQRSEVVFVSAAGAIFSVKKYTDTLNKVLKRKEIVTKFKHNLEALRPDVKEAVFRNLDTNEEVVLHYDMIHVTPPQSPCDFIKNSPLANAEGWVDVDKVKLQHVRYTNVFALGDCSSLPTSKTGAAVRKQAPVVAQNLVAVMKSQPSTAAYDGYTSCPLVTGYKSLVMAEFDYSQNPAETFPFDQGKERYSMYLVKKYALPRLYWHFMLKGRA